MGIWSIGKIRGRFQPEDFTEKQEMKVKDLICFGSVTRLMFAGWNPREITISFVVDSIHTSGLDSDDAIQTKEVSVESPEGPRTTTETTLGECPVYDPEKVWEYIQEMQRPSQMRALMQPIPVMLPGWGVRGDDVKYAYITNSSIKRTHISSKGAGGYQAEEFSTTPGAIRAVRATITLTLKEAAFFSSEEEAKKAKQTLVK